jgi:hypothetical protein
MPTRRTRPLPNLPISLESLPAPENVKRKERVALSFTKAEMGMIERVARERGEQPAVFIRTIVLTAFENSALKAMGQRPEILELSPTERRRLLLETFSCK